VKVGSSGRSSMLSAASAMVGQARRALLRVTMIWSVDEYQYSGPKAQHRHPPQNP